MASQLINLNSLDARTAELREKLNRSRRQNSTHIPHELPAKESANASLGATDGDIQDLITSIRVTSGATDDDLQPSSSSSEAFSRKQQAYTTNSQAYTENIQASSSASQAVQELLECVPDIKDWLEMTEYHNTEARTVKLDRFRRLRDLAARKKRLEEEERRLLEEAENDSWPPRQLPNKVTPLVTRVQSISETRQSLPTPITPSKPEPEGKENNDLLFPATKRAYPEDGAEQQGRDKLARGNHQDAQREDGNRRLEYASNHPGYSRPDTAGRPFSRRHSYKEPSIFQRPRSPPRGPRTFENPNPRSTRREYGNDQPQSRYDSYKGGPGDQKRQTHHERESGQSRRLDFGRRGDTRFFIVKSFNEQNVQQCMEDNIWTTQAKNSSTFTDAFEQCKNVILFFSINQSGHFQGYARMLSAPSKKIPHSWWMKSLPWGSSEPFRLEWLSTTPLEFGRVRHIHNSLNEDLPVLVGKDGQEIEAGAGVDLLRAMDLEHERERERWVSHWRGENYHRGAVVKRESTP
ncbi:YT521-B-like domain-containing protein [Triangularia setosa]|uniref:YT521-B-like domain-containing protein n=1 Tax=Triangularia setosa TaxID=2587417 RepID=A0AAN7A9H8_9PEZI|nr:YT521-B-like domain-containing protein [Podospora setosa]